MQELKEFQQGSDGSADSKHTNLAKRVDSEVQSASNALKEQIPCGILNSLGDMVHALHVQGLNLACKTADSLTKT